jgi:alginate O-acetyltransferase complex protein AlgJ
MMGAGHGLKNGKIRRKSAACRAPAGHTFAFFAPLILVYSLSFSAPYTELNKNFNRLSSHVTIRKIVKPTLANLDYAAYIANPVRRDPQSFQPKAPPKKIILSDCSFGGVLSRQCAKPESTPLTKEEIENALAWEPLAQKLWELFKTDGFSKIGTAVSSEKWGDPSIFMPYQKIVSAYLHGAGAETSLWVKIEFEPWVGFLEGAGEAGGYREIYGKLSLDNIDKKAVESAIGWIRSEYLKKELSKDEIIDWANVLASYWYPKFNTDIVDTTGMVMWPNDQTEEDIKKELSGQATVKPLVAIRGNPFGEVIYTVFILGDASLRPETAKADTVKQAAAKPAAAPLDSAVSQNFINNNLRFAGEIKANGEYETWAKKYAAMRKGLAGFVTGLPSGQLGFAGREEWLFFSKGIDYVTGGDLTKQPAEKNPLPRLVELRSYLAASGVRLLFAAVPDKAEVYYEYLPAEVPADRSSIINPFGRRFLKAVQDSGIEVIDLLPLFLDAKREDGRQKEGLYQKQDTHWSTRGLLIAADAIAGRIRQYPWYATASKVSYSTRDTTIVRQGDIVDKLAEPDRTKFPPVSIQARQVFGPDGKLYKPNDPQAPILLIGDSFTGVFELIDCKGAGVGAHIAAKSGIPVDIITSWGGGPLVRDKMVRGRQKNLPQKRVVIYMMAARDLYNYSQGWAPLTVK